MNDIWKRWSGTAKLVCGCKVDIDEAVNWEDWREPGFEVSCRTHGATEVLTAARVSR